MPNRGRVGRPLYFEALREATTRLAEGLIRCGPPARESDIAAAEAELGRKLPHGYRELLGSFNGVDLFGEAVVILGVQGSPFGAVVESNRAPRPDNLRPNEIVIAETSEGDLYTIEAEPADDRTQHRVYRLRPDADERWLAGSDLASWLEATIAHQEILYDRQGEFRLEAFEGDGEITPGYALKQAERAVRKDPGSALAHYELGLALRRLDRLDAARNAFARAAHLDSTNPWPRFDLGRIQHVLGEHPEAALAFEAAANLARPEVAARFLIWAVRCRVEQNDRATGDRLRAEALRRHPTVLEDLRRAAESEEEGDASDLATLLADDIPLTRRLPLLDPGAKTPRRR